MSGADLTHIGLCGNPLKEELQPAVATLRAICEARGVTVLLHHDLARLLGAAASGLDARDLVARSQLIVALGGDGTMLRAARMIGETGRPLLGINLGSLGYLTDIPVDGLPGAIGRVLDGEYRLEARSRVHARVWRGEAMVAEAAGLNDVVVNMGPLPRTLDLELRLGDVTLGRWLGDGVIFATAAGSTAYSLSAGGAICAPDVRGLLVTPICPHSLGVRPLILGDDVDVELVVREVGEGATLTADGQVATPLAEGDRLTCHLDRPLVNLVKFTDSSFFQILRQKLHWGIAPSIRSNSRRHRTGYGSVDEGA
ncbi:MAG: NAD(+)/NADH kinase [Candidatus Krumholzibacteriia bacterium]